MHEVIREINRQRLERAPAPSYALDLAALVELVHLHRHRSPHDGLVGYLMHYRHVFNDRK